ncbi:NHL repeat-containing protein [Bdellovibrio sp. HCB274]|uniref:NHL repeat-containing protein n=1 Tax=Bdellovibrio sp. HCB274 TaxID=3394361 RepID=UPI0039B53B5E
MNVHFLILPILAFALSACTLDVNMLGKLASEEASDDGLFPLGEKKYLYGQLTSMATMSDGKIVGIDNSGNGAVILLNSDFTNNKVIAEYGVTGSGPGEVNLPRHVAVDRYDNIYITDNGNYRIQKFNKNGIYQHQWGSFGSNASDPFQFSLINGIAVDSTGNVYVTTGLMSVFLEVRVFNPSGGFVRKFGQLDDGSCSSGSCPGYMQRAQGIALDSADNVYVADSRRGVVHKFDSSGLPTDVFGSLGSGLGQITYDSELELNISSDGNLYIAESTSGNKVHKWSLTGTPSPNIGTNGSALSEYTNPISIVTDATGKIIVFDAPTGSLGKILTYGANGSFLNTYRGGGSGDGQMDGVLAVAVYKDEFFVAADMGNSRLVMWDYQGQFIRNIGGPGSADGQFVFPRSVAVDSQGNIYVWDIGGSRIQKFNKFGVFQKKWDGDGQAGGKIISSNVVAIGPNDEVYVGDGFQHKIQIFDSEGVYLDEIGSGIVDGPSGIAFGKNNNIYVADLNSGAKVFDISLSTKLKLGEITSASFGNLSGVATTSTGDIYITDVVSNKVFHYSADYSSTPAYTLMNSWGGAGASKGKFNTLIGIATDVNDFIYAADAVNCRIQKFDGTGLPR